MDKAYYPLEVRIDDGLFALEPTAYLCLGK